jgi:hypothetical protein
MGSQRDKCGLNALVGSYRVPPGPAHSQVGPREFDHSLRAEGVEGVAEQGNLALLGHGAGSSCRSLNAQRVDVSTQAERTLMSHI